MAIPSRAVVTTLMGGYEALGEQPMSEASSMPFLCLSDDPDLTSATWQVRHVEALLPGDSIRSARDVKLRLHRYLADVDEVLWIDNSVLLTAPAEELLDEWLASADVAIPQHSFRGSTAEEFGEVASRGLDDLSRIYEQYAHYRVSFPDALEDQALWTGMFARRLEAPGVREFGERWMEQVLRYSRRDQLSVTMALRSTNPRFVSPTLNNIASARHTWPVSKQRRLTAGFRALDFIPESLADMREQVAAEHARFEVVKLRARLADDALERADLVAEIAELTSRQQPLEQANAHLKEQLESVLRSRSFRLTAAPRRLASSARAATARH